MESFPYSSYSSEYSECPICIEELVNPFKTPCCNQELHSECFNKCINTNGKCPFCRSIIEDRRITIEVINPLIIQDQRQTKYMAFCTSIIFCMFFVYFLVAVPINLNYSNNNNNYNPNFTKFNNTLNWNMN
jgi:hypothetical protein